MQKDTNGNIVFTDRMTIDRKQRAAPREDGQAENASEDRARVRTKQGRERVEIWYGKGHYEKDIKIPITDTGAVDCAGYNPGAVTFFCRADHRYQASRGRGRSLRWPVIA